MILHSDNQQIIGKEGAFQIQQERVHGRLVWYNNNYVQSETASELLIWVYDSWNDRETQSLLYDS